MDRKEFLRGCAGGLCGCAAACLPVRAETAAKPEDWKIPFVQQRYAKLLGALSRRLDQAQMSAVLQELGEYCAATNLGGQLAKLRGDPDGYAKFIAQVSGGTVKVEHAGDAYVQIYQPKGDCECPFVSSAAKTPGIVCECTLGNHRHVWRQILEREVAATMKESIMRGGKRCVVEIRPAEI